jgi:hypothetical protein
MASAHRRLIVVYFGSFDVAGERRQRLIETPGSHAANYKPGHQRAEDLPGDDRARVAV